MSLYAELRRLAGDTNGDHTESLFNEIWPHIKAELYRAANSRLHETSFNLCEVVDSLTRSASLPPELRTYIKSMGKERLGDPACSNLLNRLCKELEAEQLQVRVAYRHYARKLIVLVLW